MKPMKYLLLAATILAPLSVQADSVEGDLKKYDRGKQLVLQIKGKTTTFVITSKTKFFDMTGREYPEMADPKDTIWKISSTVTVSFHMKGGKRIADGVTFPYGKVPPELMNKTGAPVVSPDSNPEPIGNVPELSVKIGDRLPEFAISSFSGEKLTNASFAGKVVVLDFWASWCGPCKLLTPVMQKLHDQFKSSGVMVVGANCAEESANGLGKDYVKQHGYTFPFAFADSLAKKLQITAIPVVIVIDKQGIVQLIQAGYEEGCDKKLEAVIKSLLEQR